MWWKPEAGGPVEARGTPPWPGTDAWWRWRQPVHALWWGPDALWDAGRAEPPADGSPPVPTRHADFAAWAERHPGRQARLWLSAWHTVELAVDRDLPLRDDAALLAYARPLLQHYHGEAAAHWPLSPWRSGRGQGVSAWTDGDLATLQAQARAHGVRLRAISPWWARACQQLLGLAAWQAGPRRGRLLITERQLLVDLHLVDDTLQHIQLRRLDAPDRPALLDWLAAEPLDALTVSGPRSPALADDAPLWHLAWGWSAPGSAEATRPLPARAARQDPDFAQRRERCAQRLRELDVTAGMSSSHPPLPWWSGRAQATSGSTAGLRLGGAR